MWNFIYAECIRSAVLSDPTTPTADSVPSVYGLLASLRRVVYVSLVFWTPMVVPDHFALLVSATTSPQRVLSIRVPNIRLRVCLAGLLLSISVILVRLNGPQRTTVTNDLSVTGQLDRGYLTFLFYYLAGWVSRFMYFLSNYSRVGDPSSRPRRWSKGIPSPLGDI